MVERKKSAAQNFLKLLLPVVILVIAPRLVSAQSCPGDYPERLQGLSNEIQVSLIKAKDMSVRALTRAGGILQRPKREKTGYDGFLERLLMNTVITKAASFVPGGNLAQSTMIGFYENARGSREAAELNERLVDYEWLDRELAKLEAIYDFAKNPAKLKCAHAAAYAELSSAEEQKKYLTDMQEYSTQIGDSIPEYNELSLDILVKWVNDNYDFKRQLTRGLLVLKVHVDDGNLRKANPKLVGPSAADNVAEMMNDLMAILVIKPFDLKIRKMILIRGTIKGCASCDVMFLLDRNNNFIEYPSYDNALNARAAYAAISGKNFGSYNIKFGN